MSSNSLPTYGRRGEDEEEAGRPLSNYYQLHLTYGFLPCHVVGDGTPPLCFVMCHCPPGMLSLFYSNGNKHESDTISIVSLSLFGDSR